MSYGEVQLDFQIKNSHCSRNVSSEAGGLREGRVDDALESQPFLGKVNVLENWVGPLSPN